jgi:hypothetical protein
MATGIRTAGPTPRVGPRRGVAPRRWTAQAWGAIGSVALFLAITCWWLSQDHSIPIFDAGRHLFSAFYAYEALAAGHIVHALTLASPYPPLAYMVGDLGISLGGIDVAPPIIAENFVFVPLLALGCYHVGRMAFDRTAGLLAVVFALGSPLITAQFHVFMTDAPETAMVAASLWAILATEGFTRVGISAIAGLAVGLGLLAKEPLVFYVVGPVAVTAIRGGWKARRGLLAFALVALAVALPWYLRELAQVKSIGSSVLTSSSSPGDVSPPPLSIDNFEWYFWNMLNFQLYAPLFALSAIGWVWAMVGFARRRPVSRFAVELALGAFVAWLAITETFPHDTRYSMPLLVYLALFGVGWIVRLPRTPRAVAMTVLILAAGANVAGASFGLGSQVQLRVLASRSGSLQAPGLVTLYSSEGFLVSGPRRDGDILATLRALRRDGITTVVLEPSTLEDAAFSAPGIFALDRIVRLETLLGDRVLGDGVLGARVPVESFTQQFAVLHSGPIEAGAAPPCVTLSNGDGVWITLGDPRAPGVRDYCPSRDPRFYG